MTFGDLLARFHGMRALVVGDLMLDEYIVGRATRISPEAPVMVVRQTSTRYMPGGAANVARNLVSLGARVGMVGVVGVDLAGETLLTSLQDSGIQTNHVLKDATRMTTRKTRVLADHAHQVLRIDHETEEPLTPATETSVLECIEEMLGDLDVLVLSDYLKGTITDSVARSSIQMARARGVPVVANPKPRTLSNYAAASVISLNRLEATEALEGVYNLRDEEALPAAEHLKEKLGVDCVLITLGDAGIAVAGPDSFAIPAPKVEVYDTAGAGDTVVATVALGIAAHGCDRSVFALAAQTAASVVKKVGVAAPSREDLRALEVLPAH